MRMSVSDEVGALRVLTDVLDPAYGHVLRFRCITCERNPDRPPDAVASPNHALGEGSPCFVWHVPEGTYPHIQCEHSRGFIVLPFDFRVWRPHLLHDVRAEWDRAFISSRGVSVQAWNHREKREIYLKGWGDGVR